MENLYIGGEEPKRKLPNAKLIAGILLIFLLVLVCFFLWHPMFNFRNGGFVGNRNGSSATDIPNPPHGTIVMNLRPAGSATTGLYAFPVASNTFVRSPYSYFLPVASNDGTVLLGAGLVLQGGANNASILRVIEGVDGQKLVYASTTENKPFWNVALSPNKSQYTFEVAPKVAANDASRFVPSNWSIYLGEGTSTPVFVAHGYRAHFSPDGSVLVYLGDDGIHSYTIASKADTLAVPFTKGSGAVSTKVMFAVSRDGTRLAYSDPYAETVMILPITSWAPFTLGGGTVYRHQAFWPVFSPNGNWLAFEAFNGDLVKGTALSDKRLMLLNIASGKTLVLANLDAYPQDDIAISDWIEDPK